MQNLGVYAIISIIGVADDNQLIDSTFRGH
jgi:hypothetical protein